MPSVIRKNVYFWDSFSEYFIMKSSTHTHHLPPSGCLCSLLHPSDSGCFCLRCGCVPLLTRWDECFQRETRQKSPRSYYLAKLSCDGKILLKEWYLNNWSPGALKLQGPAVIWVEGHLNEIFISLFKSGYIIQPLRHCHLLLLPYSPCLIPPRFPSLFLPFSICKLISLFIKN